jgi:hypothetical protein
MNSLHQYMTIKQNALSSHRPSYPVPQLMSDKDAKCMNNAREDLKQAYNKERAKPASQRNLDLILEMDRQLHSRLC